MIFQRIAERIFFARGQFAVTNRHAIAQRVSIIIGQMKTKFRGFANECF